MRMGHLLVINDNSKIKAHLKRRQTSLEYDASVQELHSILMMKTTGGSAHAKVKAFLKTLDGCLAWQKLVEVYEHGGDIEIGASNTMEQLQGLRLDKNTRGGYAWYESSFETYTQELEDIDAPVPKFMQRTMFAKGISDPIFGNILDNYTDYDLDTLKQKLKNKAIERKVYNGYGNSSRRSNKKKRSDKRTAKKTKRKARQNTTKTPGNNNTDTEKPPDGSGFSSEVWNKMSAANKKWISEQRNNKPQYGNQYTPSNQSRQNNTTSSPTPTPTPNTDSTPSNTQAPQQSIFTNPSRSMRMFRRAPIVDGQPPPPDAEEAQAATSARARRIWDNSTYIRRVKERFPIVYSLERGSQPVAPNAPTNIPGHTQNFDRVKDMWLVNRPEYNEGTYRAEIEGVAYGAPMYQDYDQQHLPT